jgi:hypothetical protein
VILDEALTLPLGIHRTAAIVEWFQGLFSRNQSPPVLVGGAAVELYTGGAYTTGDLDFIGDVPDEVATKLIEAGFHPEGRHWIHEAGQIYLELPGSSLEPGAQVAEIRVGASSVLAVSAEDILIDRLASWQFWKSSVDAVNAYLVWVSQIPAMDRSRIESLARQREVQPALESLIKFVSRAVDRPPSRKELEEWAGSIS